MESFDEPTRKAAAPRSPGLDDGGTADMSGETVMAWAIAVVTAAGPVGMMVVSIIAYRESLRDLREAEEDHQRFLCEMRELRRRL